MTKTLIIDPKHNTPGMHDDSGAFEPHAQALHRALEDSTRLSFDNFLPPPVRLSELIREMGEARSEEDLVHVGHGWHVGAECGFTMHDLTRMRLFFSKMSMLKRAIFFSCSTASDPLKTSLAWTIAHENNIEVLAHTNEGRDVENPNVVHIARGGFRSLPDWRGKKSPNWHRWVDFMRGLGFVTLAQAFLGYDTTSPSFRFFNDADGFLQWEPREDVIPTQP